MGFVLLYSFERTDFVHLYISGDDTWMVPPVPIPNTVVKHPEAESTCLVTGREDRKLPVTDLSKAQAPEELALLLTGRMPERPKNQARRAQMIR